MKKFVSVIAALSLMLSAAPAITSYAAETATASITSEVSAETTDIAHIAGEWKYQSSDTNLPVNITPTDYGTVVINKDGTYTFTDLSGKTSSGTVQFSIETIGGKPFQCISLYEGEERRFGGYYHSDDPDAIYYGNNHVSRLVRKGAAEASLSGFTGVWKYQESKGGFPVDVSASETGTFEVNADGTYKYTDIDGNTATGEVKLGDETIGGKMFTVLRFFEGSEIKHTATYRAERPDELYIGNAVRVRLVREADKKSLATHAIEKMDAYSFLDFTFASGLAHSDKADFTVNNTPYYKVTDLSLFKSVDEVKELIGKKFTGEVKDYFMSECNARFLEKNGILYMNEGARGSLAFNTTDGVVISNVTADSFTATTVSSNDIQGKCRAVFAFENGSWKMSSFTTGDFKTDSAPATQPAVLVKGDANCDGQTDMSDVVLIMQALSNPNKYGENGTASIHLTAQGKANADVNGGGLTIGDAQAIQKALLNK